MKAKAKDGITVELSQLAARELYELARAPRIVDVRLSEATKAELLKAMKPVVDKDATDGA